MRILHVTPYYEHAWAYGGIPRVVTALARAQAGLGAAVSVLTTDVRDAGSRAPAGPGAGPVVVHTLPNLSNRVAYHLQFFTPWGLGAFLEAQLHRFDVVHVHGCHHWLGAQVARRAGRGPRYVLTPNGTAPRIERRVLAKWVFDASVGRHVLPRAELVLAVSEAERRQLAGLGIAPGRLAVVPNPVEAPALDAPATARFRRRHGLEGARVVLFLGKLTPRKGVDTLLRAFGQVARSDERLVVAGNDLGEGARLEALAVSLGLGARVTFTGLLEGAERWAALGAAACFALPARDEAFGIAAAEAMLAGVPAVVADDSGCGELVTAAGGGVTVPAGDVARLGRAVRALLDDEGVRRGMPAAGRWVAGYTSATAVAQRTLELYGRAPLREAS